MKNHNAYVGGIPDCWYSGSVDDLWIEYKYLPINKPNATVVPNLSQQQLYWIRNRLEEGRNVWVIVGYKPGGVIYRDYTEMEKGIPPDVFLQRSMTRKDLAKEIQNGTT